MTSKHALRLLVTTLLHRGKRDGRFKPSEMARRLERELGETGEDISMTKVKTHHDFHSEFAEHCLTTYGSGGEYTTYEPHYQFGQESALEDEFEGRAYDDVREDLRALHERRYPEVDYDSVEEAVRFAYNRTRASLT